jgi:hypothetical protein
MSKAMAIPQSTTWMLVQHYCSDDDVQTFVATEVVGAWPYVRPKTARQIFQLARQRFGDRRCLDLIIHQH